MRKLIARFIREDAGQDLIEYALVAGIITTGVVVIIGTIGGKVKTLFTNLDNVMP